jgi:hypothetical protein
MWSETVTSFLNNNDDINIMIMLLKPVGGSYLKNTRLAPVCIMSCTILTTRTRNPRFLTPHFGQKTGFRARNAGMNEIKSGIPCSAYNTRFTTLEMAM